MKNIFLLLMFGSILLFSCNDNGDTGRKKSDKQDKYNENDAHLTNKKGRGRHLISCGGQTFLSRRNTGTVYSDSIQVVHDFANNIMGEYMKLKLDERDQTAYFLFDAGTVAKYLYDNVGTIQDIQFILARDTNIAQLHLVLAGIDYDGNHIYIPGQGGSQFVLEECLPCPPGTNCFSAYLEAAITSVSPGPKPINVCDVHFPNPRAVGKPYTMQLDKAQAKRMIEVYARLPLFHNKPDHQVSSFLFDAGTLFSYLHDESNIQDLVIALGIDPISSQLTLIISGIDVAGHHVYFKKNGAIAVLTHPYICQPSGACYASSNLE